MLSQPVHQPGISQRQYLLHLRTGVLAVGHVLDYNNKNSWRTHETCGLSWPWLILHWLLKRASKCPQRKLKWQAWECKMWSSKARVSHPCKLLSLCANICREGMRTEKISSASLINYTPHFSFFIVLVSSSAEDTCLDCPCCKLHTNCGFGINIKGIACEATEDIGFSNCRVSNDDHFEKEVIPTEWAFVLKNHWTVKQFYNESVIVSIWILSRGTMVNSTLAWSRSKQLSFQRRVCKKANGFKSDWSLGQGKHPVHSYQEGSSLLRIVEWYSNAQLLRDKHW